MIVFSFSTFRRLLHCLLVGTFWLSWEGDGQESQQSDAGDSCALQETSTGETSGAKMCSAGTSTQATLDLEGEPPPSFKVSQASYWPCLTCCCCSVTKLCPILCNPIDCSMADLPVPHHLPEFAQVHVHWIGDAIQPSRLLLSPSSALNLSQHQGLFQWVGYSHQMAKVLELQLSVLPMSIQSGFLLGLTSLIIFTMPLSLNLNSL